MMTQEYDIHIIVARYCGRFNRLKYNDNKIRRRSFKLENLRVIEDGIHVMLVASNVTGFLLLNNGALCPSHSTRVARAPFVSSAPSAAIPNTILLYGPLKMMGRSFRTDDLLMIETDFRLMIIISNILCKGGKLVLHDKSICPARDSRGSRTPVVISTSPSSKPRAKRQHAAVSENASDATLAMVRHQSSVASTIASNSSFPTPYTLTT